MFSGMSFPVALISSEDRAFDANEAAHQPPVRVEEFPLLDAPEQAIFYICDCDGRMTHRSQECLELAAEVSAGAVDHDAGQIFPPASDTLKAVIQRIEQWKAPVIREETFNLGGEQKRYRSIHLGLYSDDNKLTGVAAVYQDAADANGPESTLARRRERFDDITQLSVDWIWETDRDFNLTYVSPRVTDSLSFLPRELEGRNLLDIGFLEDARGLSMGHKTPFRDIVYRIEDRNGKWRSFLLSGLPYYCSAAGTCLGLRGTARELAVRPNSAHHSSGLPAAESIAGWLADPVLARDLQHALSRDQMHLCFHPLVDMATGRVTGAETLLRWVHPERGEVPPDLFIPIAESSGAIAEIGEWVLRSACQQAKKWQDAGLPPIRIGVNLSPAQFHHNDLVSTVRRALSHASLAPQWLEIEITEGMIVDEVEHVIHILHSLRDLGVHLAIDDFGTGYSSLAYLQRFPVNRVKIDRGFVEGIRSNAGNAAITRAIINLSHDLGMTVIAEGVETRGQFDHLRDEGCDEAQGFHFTRPLRAAEMTGWLFAHTLSRSDTERFQSLVGPAPTSGSERDYGRPTAARISQTFPIWQSLS